MDPGKDEKASIVDNQMKVDLALLRRPTDKLIAWGKNFASNLK